LLRYYVIATFIVLTVAVAVTAWGNRDAIRARIAPTEAPSHAQAGSTPHSGFEAADRAGGGSLRGDAPWALSALPDCMEQISVSSGPIAYVRSKLPRGAAVIPPGSQLVYGPCTIFVRDGELLVSRGSDRLRVPPYVTLFQDDDGTLALLRQAGTHGELRIYSKTRIFNQ
jgi:hypothetical protein